MKKSLISLLIVFTIVLAGVLSLTPQKASADFIYSKKIVSVVYDDSVSMGSNAPYANYAMQAFCGLLNSEDSLYITYVGNPKTANPISLSEANIHNSINTIRAHGSSAQSTPYETVETAMNVLRKGTDKNESTEYWLVVITDGQFQGGDVRKGLSDFADEKMPNGTKAKIFYLPIGPNAVKLKIEKPNFEEKPSDGADAIVETMAAIANKVSGRSLVSSSNITYIDSKTVSVTSEVPLMNISLLSQKSSAKVKSAYMDGNSESLRISRSVSFSHPRNSALSGGGFIISSDKGNIAPGKYIIEFDKEISPENVVIMFEPALEVRAEITCNGREINSLAELEKMHEKDTISVSYKVYEYGTDNEIDITKLPEGTSCGITITENDKIVRSESGTNMSIDSYQLDDVKTEIRAQICLPDFSPIEFYAEFIPQTYVEYTLGAEFGGTDSVKLSGISGTHDLSVIFTLYGNGKPVTDKKTVENFKPQISFSANGNDGTTEITSDGKIVFKPTKASGDSSAASFDVTVTCTVNGVTAYKTYRVINPVYTVKADYGSDIKQIDLADIGKKHGLSIVFTFYKDDIPMTDTSEIKALIPDIDFPDGEGGTEVYTSDGKLVFTPNKTAAKTSGGGTHTVTITCRFVDSTATASYTVIIPEYEIRAEYGSDIRDVHLMDIGKNHGLSIIFTFYVNGERITDTEAVKALESNINIDIPNGEGGTMAYTSDGKLVYTPNKTAAKASGGGMYTVTLTYSFFESRNTVSYTVIIPEYEIRAEYGSDIRDVHLMDIGKNHGLSIIFTFYVNGERITDTEAVKALESNINIDIPDGEGGTRAYTSDGKLVYTPNKTAANTSGGGTHTVTLTYSFFESRNTVSYTVIIPEYDIKAEYGSDIRHIPLADIGKDHGLSIIFTFYINGERITDPEIVKALEPNVTAEHGDDGTKVLTEDGKLIFTPNKTTANTSGGGYHNVEVKCATHGAEAFLSYSILIPGYAIVVVEPETPIAKTKFFGNTTSISFYVTKDGVKLTGAELGHVTATLEGERDDLMRTVEILDDGTVICTPYSEKEHKVTFWGWFINPRTYWRLNGDDITVKFTSYFGEETGVISVCGADGRYIFLNVICPLLFWVALFAFAGWWFHCSRYKPKFKDKTMLYIAKMTYDSTKRCHVIHKGKKIYVKDKNKWFSLRKGEVSIIFPPTMTPLSFVSDEIRFIASHSGIEVVAFGQKKNTVYTGDIIPKRPIANMPAPNGFIRVNQLIKYFQEKNVNTLDIIPVDFKTPSCNFNKFSNFNTRKFTIFTNPNPQKSNEYIIVFYYR